MTQSKSDPELFGRTGELRAVQRALGDRTGAGCVLVGEEGVGKSLIARHALAAAAEDGDEVAHVIATGSAAATPLGALQSLLFDQTHGEERQPRWRLVPPAPGCRLVVLVDDAHLLDDASAALLLEATGAPDVAVIATVSSHAPLPDAVTALWKDRGAARIEIEPLDTAGVAALTASLVGGKVPDWVARRLERDSGGRPLEVRERVLAALEEGRLASVDGQWALIGDPPIPASLVEIVTGRLERFDASCRELLELLVLCGPLSFPLIDRLGLSGALADLEDAGVARVADHARSPVGIVPNARDGDHGLSVHLEHPVFHQAVVAGSTPRRRRELYARVARAATELGGDDRRVTRWRFRAGEAVEVAELLDAARACYRDGAYAHCGELAEAAWLREPSFEAGQLYGYALGESGRSIEAELVLAQVHDLATDDRSRVLIALTRSENALRGLGDPERADELCCQARETIEDPKWRAELDAHRAMGTLRSGRIDEAVRALEGLLDPDRNGERAAVTAAYTIGIALIHAGRAEDASAIALEAMPIHEALWSADQLTEPGVHHITTLFALVAAGRAAEAAPLLEYGRDLTRFQVPRYGYAWMSYLAGRAALRMGRCDDATGCLLEAAPIFLESRRAEEACWCETGVAIAAGLQGDAERARVHLDAARALSGSSERLNEPLRAEAEGWLAMADGMGDAARDRFSRGATAALATGDRLGASQLLTALARTGAPAQALPELERLTTAIQGELIGLQAAIAAALANPESPEATLDLAADCEDRGLVVEAAELTACAVGALRRAGRSRLAAREASRGRERLARCQRVRTPLLVDLSTAAPLTSRELDVARLAAERLSSKEIAQRLGIANRTVDNHLRNVYQKLGIGGRVDLAEALGIAPTSPNT